MAWMQTNTGKAFDLTRPDPRLVDFENDVAPALGKIARFVGHTDGRFGYSVAQHCVLGAETLYEETGSLRLAALFLLHDAHEAYIGDISQPFEALMNEMYHGYFSAHIREAKERLDAAIYRAAGVHLPNDDEKVTIKGHDIAMMNAERHALMPRMRWAPGVEAIPAVEVCVAELGPWDPVTAREEWLLAFTQFITVKQEKQ